MRRHDWTTDPALALSWGAHELARCSVCGLFRVRWQRRGYKSWKVYQKSKEGRVIREAGPCVTQAELFPQGLQA